MDKIGILKAKVDYHKTVFTAFLAGTVASALGFYANLNNDIAKTIFMWTLFAFAIGVLASMYYYRRRHRELIDELRK